MDRKKKRSFFSSRRGLKVAGSMKLVGGERVTVAAQSSRVTRQRNFYILGRYPSSSPRFDVVIDVVETTLL